MQYQYLGAQEGCASSSHSPLLQLLACWHCVLLKADAGEVRYKCISRYSEENYLKLRKIRIGKVDYARECFSLHSEGRKSA